MTPETRERALAVLSMIDSDLENDVAKWDGQPATAQRVAIMHAELSAVVAGLAGVVRKIIEEDGS